MYNINEIPDDTVDGWRRNMDLSNLVPDIVTLSASVIGLAWTWGKIDNRIEQLEEQRKEDRLDDERKEDRFDDERKEIQRVAQLTADKLNELTVTLEKIGTAIWGYDGNNGLRGELRETKADVKDLLSHLIKFKTDE